MEFHDLLLQPQGTTRPFEGLEQASAISLLAAENPRNRRQRTLLAVQPTVSKPSSTSCFLTRVNNGWADLKRLDDPVVTPPSLVSEMSAFNNIRAFSKRWRRSSFSYQRFDCSRSSPFSRTTYLFTEISFATMIVSVARVATESQNLYPCKLIEASD